MNYAQFREKIENLRDKADIEKQEAAEFIDRNILTAEYMAYVKVLELLKQWNGY